MLNKFGFVRVTAISSHIYVGNPDSNAEDFIYYLSKLTDSDIIVGQELGITGYTCANLFQQEALLKQAITAVTKIALTTKNSGQLVVVGCPIPIENSLYNCAVVMNRGRVIGVVPKQYLPNYKEFYEGRWFRGADGREPQFVDLWFDKGWIVPFGIDLLFETEAQFGNRKLVVGCEICEDLWMPIPPSSYQAMKGASILLNLSASNETVAKSKYRKDLVVGQSGRCMAAYVYASAGPSESSTDLVFGGHCIIAENGSLVDESSRVGDGNPIKMDSKHITADVDVEKLMFERRNTTSFDDQPVPRTYRDVSFELSDKNKDSLKRKIIGLPFVPRDKETLDDRCAEIFGIQVASMMKRFDSMNHRVKPHIGVSGGLDSTLALLALVKTFDNAGYPRKDIIGVTMPGFGTTNRTKNNAVELMMELGITSKEVDIRKQSLQMFKDMDHLVFKIINPKYFDSQGLQEAIKSVPVEEQHDLVFENVQARARTNTLMNMGFVIGTGDLTEGALGWCTYNADHMSMYNPNCSIPKTLVKFLVQYAAENQFKGRISEVLMDIVGTPISPELLPVAGDGTIQQTTEGTLGAFELHDFFLFNFLRNGYSPDKIIWLAKHADFVQSHSEEDIQKAMKLFIERFFSNQYKRSCVPDGPKVGSVSLSPRGDWRMPSDADATIWKNLIGV